MAKLELAWTDIDNGDEIVYSFPAVNEVCERCEGFGTHLNPSIGEHAYTAEEFNDSFDNDEKEEYFRRGGIYDVTCHACKGNKVTLVVNEGELTAAEKELYESYQEYVSQCAQWDAEDRRTRYYESGGYDY